MGTPWLILVTSLVLSLPPSSFSSLPSPPNSLTKGASLSVEKPNRVLVSPNKVFSAGFYSVGENAYCFAIWFAEPLYNGNHTIVWMANRDQPVNGRLSKLSLLKNGNLVLTDAAQLTVWASDTVSISPLRLLLLDTGNLVLFTLEERVILWESFDSPTDTLLPNQRLTRTTRLVSSRSQSNYSSGFYKLFFDDENLLRLRFEGPEVSSIYWPPPWLNSWQAGRLTMDVDGNVRLYSLDKSTKRWNVSWQAILQPCTIHGVCGPNALCTYVPGEKSGRRCSCLPGYRRKSPTEWSLGCEPDFSFSCNGSEFGFIHLKHVEFYGYDIMFYSNYTLESCKNECLKRCDCYGFQYKFDYVNHYYLCYTKSLLLNGYRSPGFGDSFYVKLSKTSLSSYTNLGVNLGLDCLRPVSLQLNRSYKKPQENESLQFAIYDAATHGYLQVATGFRRFTYDELKKASRNFREEIGRGGGGVVYKGVLSDHRVAAIKRLNEANQGEAEFSAEMVTGKSPTIGHQTSGNPGEMEQRGLVRWVREKMNGNGSKEARLEEIIDPVMKDSYDVGKMETLVEVALQCVEEDKDARPTMKQVVERLLLQENEY
ncbi:lectin protein kinase family protein [Actinidia rufa]|uniref:non-specific serine/threonine protein kinase n=1 Tax=Actinidia rufa TaxID=165716 RepID=A0A7J0GHI5_9ERIC|nr:lectin protein kinase family protein [Actinidia rufa]